MNQHKPEYTNHLIKETSPYLLQHAHNPVDWYPWSQEALQKAKDENKLIVLSIGYSACHWCHVMEHESFEDTEVAEVMNALYVNIKVDREERPDIDQIYMGALQLMNGTGGWPLNCILLPDQRPIYGGTYFKKSDWINILSNIAAMYRNKPEELLDYADKLIQGVRRMELITERSNDRTFNKNDLDEIYKNWQRYLDQDFGGTQSAPKFPVPSNFDFLLNYLHSTHDEKLNKYLQLSFKNIASKGIYDQIGGGIYRYSVDAYWKIPHFEKMLYDQAQIISLYAKAYKRYHIDLHKNTFESCINFCLRELKNPIDKGFYSALDADSEGQEGKFYCWTAAEIREVLNVDASLYMDFYQITEEGNFEHGLNNLFELNSMDELIQKYSMDEFSIRKKIKELNQILFQYREKRVRPGLDDKQLCAWNALLLKAFCEAYTVEGMEVYLQEALELEQFISNKLMQDGKLYRSYKKGESKIPAFFDDYAFYIEALIKLFEISSNEKFIVEAKRLTNYSIENFMDEQSGLFWYTSNHSENLVARKQEFYDSVIPSSNSVMMMNLYKLSAVFANIEYEEIAENMLFSIIEQTKRYPLSYSNWFNGMLYHLNPKIEIVIVGARANEMFLEMHSKISAGITIYYSTSASELSIFKSRYVSNKTLIYVCVNKSCQMPVESIDSALAQLAVKS